MAHPMSISETVSKMANQTSTTLGWDVVVNYAESDINNLLRKTFKDKSKAQITEVKCQIAVIDPLNPTKRTIIHYDFKLGVPLLSFNSRGAEGPSCNLTLPVVDGTVRAEGGSPTTIDAGRYSLVLGTLKLATAEGAADPDTKPFDQPFVIPGHGSKQGCVVIDLPTSKDLTVSIDNDGQSSAPDIPIIDFYIPNISLAIQELLVVEYKDIRYEIARVKATPPPSGTIQLKPKSFRFDAFLPSESSKFSGAGVLTLFIQTRDVNYGREKELATEWERQWRSALACSPIPKGRTASIIFSKDMIYEIVLKPAIEAKSFKGTLKDSKGSLKVEVDTGKNIHRDGMDKNYANVRYYASPVSMNPPPLVLTLSEHAGSAIYAVSWEFEYKCEWSIGIIDPPDSIPIYGVVKATHTLPKDSTAHPKVVTFLDDYSFKLDCSVSKDQWGAKFEAEQRSGWLEWGKSGLLQDWVTSLNVDLPGFELHFQSVNYFLTTNLLFPDDKQVIVVDKTSGLHVPADLYLVGSVKAK